METDDNINNVGFVNDSTERNLISKELLASAMYDEQTHDIQTILSRYRKIDSFDISSQHIYEMPFVSFFSQPQVQGRIQGVMGINGTLKCRLTWNVSPMVQGLYVLFYTPPGLNFYNDFHELSLGDGAKAFYTGFPHVIVNLSRVSSAELEVPFIGETAYIPLYKTNIQPQLGSFVLVEYSPIRSHDSPVHATVNIYFAMDKVTTFGTQPKVANAQSFPKSGAMEATKKKTDEKVSHKLKSWKKTLQPVLNLVPEADWVYGGVTTALDWLGFSAPIHPDKQKPVQLSAYMDIANGDNNFVGARLAQTKDAGINKLEGLSIDELNLKDYLGTYEYMNQFTVGKNQEQGTLLASYPCSPGSMEFGEMSHRVGGDAIIRNGNHLSYMANIYEYYRGSLDIKIEPVATMFHSCRLRLIVTPEDMSEAYNNMSYTYTQIIDINDPKSLEFNVPYLSQNPWRPTSGEIPEKPITIKFYLENVLVAPDNVSDSIQFFLFVKAGEDFELCVPQADHQLTFITDFKIPAPKPVAAAQSSKLAEGFNKTEEAYKLAVGDPVVSLRPLIKRFMRCGDVGSSELYLSRGPIIRANLDDISDKNPHNDYITFIAHSFVFSRGSMRFMENGYTVSDFSLSTATHNGPYYNGITTTTENQNLCNFSYNANLIEPFKVEIPYYSYFIREAYCNSQYKPPTGVLLKTVITAGNSHLLRACGDDFDFHFKRGVTPRIEWKPTPASPKN